MPEPTPRARGDEDEELPVPHECLTPQERLRLAAELYLKAMRRYMAEQAAGQAASEAPKPEQPGEVA
jgi:hypothetical protein